MVVVQVKAWQGTAYDTGVFDQLRRAKTRWPEVTGGLILTTADRATDAFQLAAAELAAEIDAEVRVLCRRDVLHLLLAAHLNPQRICGRSTDKGAT